MSASQHHPVECRHTDGAGATIVYRYCAACAWLWPCPTVRPLPVSAIEVVRRHREVSR